MIGPLARTLSILIYHRVVAEPDPLLPDLVSAAQFESQLAVLTRWFTVLPLREAVARLRSGLLPRRAACVTFDDGYADNEQVAKPVLLRQGVPATFFVATAFLGGGRMWNDTVIETVRSASGDAVDARAAGLEPLDVSTMALRRQAVDSLIGALKYLPAAERQRKVDALANDNAAALPADLMMTEDQVRALHAAGMEIGAHTMNHPILAKLDAPSAAEEIRASRERLQRMTGAPVTLFAYPNGKPGVDYLPEHVAMVREQGFEAAVSTAWGVSNPDSDRYQLPRFTPWDPAPAKFAARLLGNTFRTKAEVV